MTIREAMEAIWKEVYFYAIEEDKQDFAHLQEVMLEDPPEYKDLRNSFLAIAHLVAAALALPPRQCDVGTARKQYARFADACHAHVDLAGRCLSTCPFRPAPADVACDRAECFAEWAQTPYAAEEGSET